MGENSALLLFSGGQDSATCLMWAVKKFDAVYTLGFSYGQRHAVELQCRQEFLSRFRVTYPEVEKRLKTDTVVDLGFLGELGKTALTHNVPIESPAFDLPNTFVPGRNIFFITSAASVAYHRNISDLIGSYIFLLIFEVLFLQDLMLLIVILMLKEKFLFGLMTLSKQIQ